MIHVLIHVSRLTLPSFPVPDNQSIVCLPVSLPLFCAFLLICLHSLFSLACFSFLSPFLSQAASCVLIPPPPALRNAPIDRQFHTIKNVLIRLHFSSLASTSPEMLQGCSIHSAASCPPPLHDWSRKAALTITPKTPPRENNRNSDALLNLKPTHDLNWVAKRDILAYILHQFLYKGMSLALLFVLTCTYLACVSNSHSSILCGHAKVLRGWADISGGNTRSPREHGEYPRQRCALVEGIFLLPARKWRHLRLQ